MILLGRLHALVVHFPIALLLVVVVLALWARRTGKSTDLLKPLLVLAAASAVLAVGSGLALAQEQTFFGYAARQLSWHRNLGIGGAAVSVVAALVALRKLQPALFLGGLAALAVGAGAHFGGILVHGDDHFVLEARAPKRVGVVQEGGAGQVMSPPVVDTIDDIPDPVPFALVDQVFTRSCTRCHDARKRKGDLRLDREEYAKAGGADGPGVVPGDRKKSLVYERISLARDHEDYMPSKGQPLTAAEVELIGRWIDGGAAWN
jgi:uncharacterized membrane protein